LSYNKNEKCTIDYNLINSVHALRKKQLDPWGVWNEHYIEEGIAKYSRIRTFSTGKYYEIPYGIYIVISVQNNSPTIQTPNYPVPSDLVLAAGRCSKGNQKAKPVEKASF